MITRPHFFIRLIALILVPAVVNAANPISMLPGASIARHGNRNDFACEFGQQAFANVSTWASKALNPSGWEARMWVAASGEPFTAKPKKGLDPNTPEGRHYIGVESPLRETIDDVWWPVGSVFFVVAAMGLLGWALLHVAGIRVPLQQTWNVLWLMADFLMSRGFAKYQGSRFAHDHMGVYKSVTMDKGATFKMKEEPVGQEDIQRLTRRGLHYALWLPVLGTLGFTALIFGLEFRTHVVGAVFLILAFLAPWVHHFLRNQWGLRNLDKMHARSEPFASKPPAGAPGNISRRFIVQEGAAALVSPTLSSPVGPTLEALFRGSASVRKAISLTVTAIIEATEEMTGETTHPQNPHEAFSNLAQRMRKWREFTENPDLLGLRPLMNLDLDKLRQAVANRSDISDVMKTACLSAIESPEWFELRLPVARFVEIATRQGLTEVSFEDEFSRAQSFMQREGADLLVFLRSRAESLMKPLYDLAAEELRAFGAPPRHINIHDPLRWISAENQKSPEAWLRHHEGVPEGYWAQWVDTEVSRHETWVFREYLGREYDRLRVASRYKIEGDPYGFGSQAISQNPEALSSFRSTLREGTEAAEAHVHALLMNREVKEPLMRDMANRLSTQAQKDRARKLIDHLFNEGNPPLTKSTMTDIADWVVKQIHLAEEEQRKKILSDVINLLRAPSLQLVTLLRRWSEGEGIPGSPLQKCEQQAA